MEWVEAAGKTVDEATEQALDQLGVALGDAEIIVVSEPKPGLFGRMRGEARVRARVRPLGARPKRERSRRGGRSGQGRQAPQKGATGPASGKQRAAAGSGAGSGSRSDTAASGDGDEVLAADSGGSGGDGNGSPGRSVAPGTGTSRSARRRRNRSKAKAGAGGVGAGSTESFDEPPRDGGGGRSESRAEDGSHNGRSSGSGEGRRAAQRAQGDSHTKETDDMAQGMTLEEQGEAGRTFLAGLLSEYGIEASVETRLLDEETVEIAATGEDLGVLVGPRGSTLIALQDLTRAVVQRQCPSRTDRILVDVAGYRERRSAALKRFSVQIAEEVLTSGQERALEAMSPADRKAVHDAVNEMAGVATRSEGEDPHRYIVIAPAG